MTAVCRVLWGPWQMAALTLELGIWEPGFDTECGPWQGLFRCDTAGHGLCVGLQQGWVTTFIPSRPIPHPLKQPVTTLSAAPLPKDRGNQTVNLP